MNKDNLIPKIPKQKRSKIRFEKILYCAEKILLENGMHLMTIKEISQIAKIKRPSIYKFFPSTESIYYALSEKHIIKFESLFQKNLANSTSKNLSWYLSLFIDLLSIYINSNKVSALLFFDLESLHTLKIVRPQNKQLLSSVFLEALKSKDIKYSVDKTTISCQLSLSILSVGFNEENCLSPRYVNEAKRAALAYISTL